MKQRLSMKQPKSRMFQRRDLNAPQSAIGQLAHQTRMLALPLRPHSRVLENTTRNELLVPVRTYQCGLYAISGLAHESRVTDGMAEHISLSFRPDSVKREGVSKRCHLPTTKPLRAHPFSAPNPPQE